MILVAFLRLVVMVLDLGRPCSVVVFHVDLSFGKIVLVTQTLRNTLLAVLFFGP